MSDSEFHTTPEIISWPYYRYNIIIPEKTETDAFEWLFIALLINTNKNNGDSKDDYSSEAVEETRTKIINEFKNEIDAPTLNKVITNVEHDFVRNKKLTDKAIKFLNDNTNLFSDKATSRFIFQDAITGIIYPYFYDQVELDSSDIKDNFRGEKSLTVNQKLRYPDNHSIKKAYKTYLRKKKEMALGLNFISTEEIIEEYGEFEFEFEALNDSETDNFKEQKNTPLPDDLDDYDITFVGQRVQFTMDVVLRDNGKSPINPFTHADDLWIKTCLKKARTSNHNVDTILSKYDVPSTKISIFKESLGVISQLKHCAEIYKIVEKYNDPELCRFVEEINDDYSRHHFDFFTNGSTLMESFARNITYNKTPRYIRKNIDYDAYCVLIDERLNNVDISNKLKKQLYDMENYSNWQKGRNNLKPILIDLIIRTELVDNPLSGNGLSLIEDMFNFYNKRNVTHYYKGRSRPENDDLNILVESIKLLDIIKKG